MGVQSVNPSWPVVQQGSSTLVRRLVKSVKIKNVRPAVTSMGNCARRVAMTVLTRKYSREMVFASAALIRYSRMEHASRLSSVRTVNTTMV